MADGLTDIHRLNSYKDYMRYTVHWSNGRPAFLAKLEALGYEVTFIEAALSFQVRWYHAASVMSPVS